MSEPVDRVARIRERLTDAFHPRRLEVTDDGERHRGHAGAATGKGHFNVEISAAALDGLSRVEAHRAVYAALGEMMGTDIHALGLSITPARGP